MSEKKPQAAKAKTQSKGQRQSGGRVPNLDTNSILHGIINATPRGFSSTPRGHERHMRRAVALVRRAARSAMPA